MSAEPKTLAVYDPQVMEYGWHVAQKSTPGLGEFVSDLPPDGHVLDLCCCPGSNIIKLMQHGFTVDATDGFAEMVARAVAREVNALPTLFQEITGERIYDVIWANFSLSRLHLALKPDGVFHIVLKLGKGEARDSLCRFYIYYQ